MYEVAGTFGQKAIHFVQFIFIPVFFLIFAIGIIQFLLARKNPTRKRKGYLYTLFGGIGVFFVAYAPLVSTYFTSNNLVNMHSESFLNGEFPLGGLIYIVFDALSEPILIYLAYFGVGYLLLAAKEPFRKRMGITLLLGSPLVWAVVHYLPNIIGAFTSA